MLGRWTGGSVLILPTTAWTVPNALFPTEARNDGYSWASTTSTVTLPASGLADGYLLVGRFEFNDTSSGRNNPQGRIVQASGAGNFVGGATGGYNRDASEDRAYVSCWSFVDTPSASATFQFQWKRDTDAPGGGTIRSSFDVIPLYYSNIGLYSSSSSAIYGGISPNQVTGFSAVFQSDVAAIEIVSNVVTVKSDNKKYLILGNQFFEGRGGRTQRWHGLRIDGTKEDAAKAYSYYRNGSNDESGDMFTHLLERSTTDITIDQFCYRGDGITAGLGGADVDGSTPVLGDHSLCVIELNDSAEVFHSVDGTGGVDLNVTGPLDQVITRLADITVNDAASWTRSTDQAMNAEVAMDALFGANISAAQEVVGTTSRWTAEAELTVNGVEDTDIFGGDYCRNNQGSTDTFGWSANILGFRALLSGDDVGVSVQELAGGEDGGRLEVQPGWSGFWGINLDTLQDLGSGFSVVVPTATQAYTGLAPEVVIRKTSTLGTNQFNALNGLVRLNYLHSFPQANLAAISAQGSVLVEVPVGSQSYTGLLPVALATDNQSVDVPVGLESYSTSAPDITVTDNQIVTPDEGTQTYTGLAPVIVIGDNQVVVIPVGDIAYSGQVPSVQVSDEQVVVPPTAVQTYTGLAPIVVIGGNIAVEVPVGAETYNTFAPTISADEQEYISSAHDSSEDDEIILAVIEQFMKIAA